MARTRWTPVFGFALTALAVSGCGGIKEDLGLAKTPPDEFAVVKRPPLSMPPDFTLRPPRPGERGPQYTEMREQAREALIGSSPDRGVSVASASGSDGRDSLGGTGYVVANSAAMPGSATAETATPVPYTPASSTESPSAGASSTSTPTAPPRGTRAATAERGRSYGEMALLDHVGVDEVNPQIRGIVDRESAEIAANQDSLVNSLMFWVDQPPPGEVVDAARENRRLRENAALGRPPTEGATPTIERKAEGRGISLF